MSNVESNTWKARVLAAMAFEREERDRRWRDCGVRAAAAHDAVVALLDEAIAHWDAAPADPQPVAVAEVLAQLRLDVALAAEVQWDDERKRVLSLIDRAAAKVAQHFERAAHRTPGQYRCKVCGARWELLSGSLDWTLRSERCGPCCDNAPMDEQIEPVSAAPIAEELLLAADELLASFRDGMPAEGTTIPNQKVQALRDAVAAARCAPAQGPALVTEWTNKDRIPSFTKAARHLIAWLNEHMHPHAKVIVTPTDAELVTGEICTGPIHDYIKD